MPKEFESKAQILKASAKRMSPSWKPRLNRFDLDLRESSQNPGLEVETIAELLR